MVCMYVVCSFMSAPKCTVVGCERKYYYYTSLQPPKAQYDDTRGSGYAKIYGFLQLLHIVWPCMICKICILNCAENNFL